MVSPNDPLIELGAEGTVRGITELVAADSAEEPTTFVAFTVKVYEVPLVRPATTQDLAVLVAVHVFESGEDVTV